MSLRELIENQIGKVTSQEMQFAVTNLNLEIEHKFKRIPTQQQMKNVLIANVEFYRNQKKLILEG